MNSLEKQFLESLGYSNLSVISGRGICGIIKFNHTVDILVGVDPISGKYLSRWMFPSIEEATDAYCDWDGLDDPTGEWIKYKGIGGDRPRIPDATDGIQFKRIL